LTKQRIVIITGMHRSGTSLVASVLQHAGVNVGERLLGPAVGNRHGHFEDVDFYKFQDRLLARFGQSLVVQSPDALGEISPEEIKQARALIQQRKMHTLWGWKDPRTSLFLEFWHSLLPEAGYVFVYRHPVDVVLSLLRRASDLEAVADPLAGLRAWQVYNEALLRFYEQHSRVCYLCSTSGVVADTDQFVRRVGQKLSLPLDATGTASRLCEGELKQIVTPAEVRDTLQQIAPNVADLYDRLEARADLPGYLLERAASLHSSALAEFSEATARFSNREQVKEATSAPLFMLLLAVLDSETMAGWTANVQRLVGEWRQRRFELDQRNNELASRQQAMAEAQRTTLQGQAKRIAQLEQELGRLRSNMIVQLAQKLRLI
jgi:hypothetical protein